MLAKIRALKAVVIASLATAALAGALPQETSQTAPPPPVPFEGWLATGESEAAERFTISFPSPVQTPFPENNTVKLLVFVPKNRIGRAPVVVMLHFWGATDNALEVEMAEELAKKGVASIALPLPYHLSRTPRGTASGELAIQADPDALRETMTQALADVRRALDWVATRPELNPQAVGVTGTSLGAIVSGLAFAVEPRFKSAAFVLGGADLAFILWNSSRVGPQREALRRAGVTEESLRATLAPVEPLTHLRPDDPRPTYVVSARHDTVIPPEATRRLAASLNNPQTLVLETGHYGGFLVRTRLVRSVAAFFESTLQGRAFTAPDRFYSPTVRFMAYLGSTDGLQVAAGLDLWRLNEQADAFATALVTPRGVRGYFGFQLGRGVSAGAIFAPRRTSVGLVWSTVF